MDRVIKVKEKTPLPVKLIYFLLTAPFFIYIPISILKTDIFLFVLDLALMIALLFTLFNEHAIKKVFGGKVAILFLVLIYIVSVLGRFAIDLLSFDMQMINVVRNLLFGMGVFVISSVWITTSDRINVIARIFVWGSFLTAVYGIRQLLFGFMQFELDRLALMGASLKEMQVLNRVRITSSFGDPLVFGFYMMIGIFFYFLARQSKILTSVTRKGHPIVLFCLVFGLVFSLTRAPLLGLICGGILLAILSFRITKKYLVIIFKLMVGVIIIIASLNVLVRSRILADSTNPILLAVNNGAESFWSLYQLAVADQHDESTYFLVNQSKDARSTAWGEGFSFLLSNPWGAGLTDRSHFTFSIGDTGILSLGLQIGIIGFVAMIILIVVVGFQSWINIHAIPHLAARRRGYIFLAIWTSIIVTGGISSIFDTSVIAIVIWTIAAILLNQKKIYTHEILSKGKYLC